MPSGCSRPPRASSDETQENHSGTEGRGAILTPSDETQENHSGTRGRRANLTRPRSFRAGAAAQAEHDMDSMAFGPICEMFVRCAESVAEPQPPRSKRNCTDRSRRRSGSSCSRGTATSDLADTSASSSQGRAKRLLQIKIKTMFVDALTRRCQPPLAARSARRWSPARRSHPSPSRATGPAARRWRRRHLPPST